MAKTFIDVDEFETQLKTLLNENMLAAAEPILQRALTEIEKRMRTQLATNIVQLIETDYSIVRQGNIVQISVGKKVP